jgi:hypothetical protein
MRKRLILRLIVALLSIGIVAACCWGISRPPDPERVIAAIRGINAHISSAVATNVPYVDPSRVAYSIVSMSGETLEIGLFALDFSASPGSHGSTSFAGTIANLGDLPVTEISATIWLYDPEGGIVDWVDLSMPATSLQPNEDMAVSGRFVPGQHPPSLLEESLFFGSNTELTITLYHWGGPVTRSGLDWLLRIFPSARIQTVWTKPSADWADWYVDLSCAKF